MPEEMKQPEVVVKNPGHKFQPGHQKFGGRKKRSPAMVRELADKMGVDPIQFLLKVIASDTVEEVRIVEGKKTRVTVPVTIEMKMDACRIVSGYLYPKLSTTQVTGKDEGPVELATLDISAIIADPALVEMAQKLAITMAEADRNPAPARILPPGDTYQDK
jgi:hypothetical protein